MGLNVAATSTSDRLKEVLTRSKKNFGPDVGQAIDSLLVNVEDLSALRDPLRERLLEIARQEAPELV